MALYAFLLTALTARYTKLLPSGLWLKIHRFSLVVWVFAWLHSVLAGTDSGVLGVMYVATGLAIVFSGAYRYWASRQRQTHVRAIIAPRRSPDERVLAAGSAAP